MIITYNDNIVTLISHPDVEPAYDETMEVNLSLDNNGRAIKRIEYTHGISKISSAQPSETFRYDTLFSEYNATGLLINTRGSRYDSIYVDPTNYRATRFTSTASYKNEEDNLTASDEYVVYPITTSQNGVTTISGGSSEYHNVFSYTKSFPNHTDFKNAAVLNEYQLYYESPLNSNYKNMPDQITRSSTDKDINGTIIFSGTSIIDIERTYDDGLLSGVNILSLNTPYKEINYFYGK